MLAGPSDPASTIRMSPRGSVQCPASRYPHHRTSGVQLTRTTVSPITAKTAETSLAPKAKERFQFGSPVRISLCKVASNWTNCTLLDAASGSARSDAAVRGFAGGFWKDSRFIIQSLTHPLVQKLGLVGAASTKIPLDINDEKTERHFPAQLPAVTRPPAKQRRIRIMERFSGSSLATRQAT